MEHSTKRQRTGIESQMLGALPCHLRWCPHLGQSPQLFLQAMGTNRHFYSVSHLTHFKCLPSGTHTKNRYISKERFVHFTETTHKMSNWCQCCLFSTANPFNLFLKLKFTLMLLLSQLPFQLSAFTATKKKIQWEIQPGEGKMEKSTRKAMEIHPETNNTNSPSMLCYCFPLTAGTPTISQVLLPLQTGCESSTASGDCCQDNWEQHILSSSLCTVLQEWKHGALAGEVTKPCAHRWPSFAISCSLGRLDKKKLFGSVEHRTVAIGKEARQQTQSCCSAIRICGCNGKRYNKNHW